ncbi:DUF2511 domain-containing protein [Pontibacter sp. 172403-2]|uniref:DUF2511 domain-containing protein n=1 Tax=Pontibacter rufus TaxID=2791028 RepID=UPI0018AFBF60|nr:DUF2511 domain-containing protein [Pontibacter sp. 172403-2]MBF9252442.1 DUF2511 domain-containing protein [Pontibacter sp. 172403-2]
MKTIFKIVAAVVLFLFIMQMCSDEEKNMTGSMASLPEKKENIFQASDFGEEWPFTTEEVEVFCDGTAVFIKSEGNIYALNGRAMGQVESKRTDITTKTYEEIWRDNPEIVGTKIPVPSEIIQKGLSMCK